MAVLTDIYSANTAITFDISSLATSSTGVAGRASTQVDNTSTKYDKCIVNVGGINGHASTAPTVGQMISLYLWGANTSLGTTNIDTITGTDGNFTLGHLSSLQSLLPVRSAGVTVATANLKYWFEPFEVGAYFGGVVPKFWGLYLTHNHTGALAASQASLFSFNGITYDIT